MVVRNKIRENFLGTQSVSESLSGLGIDRAQVLRAIESIKANARDINPQSVALELGIPRAFVYADLEILETIYHNTDKVDGHDKLIKDLVLEHKSIKRKLSKQDKELERLRGETSTAYNDGFAKGASMNFASVKSEIFASAGVDEMEQWARGVLQLDLHEALNEAKIKKSYRFLLGILHPDRSGVNTTDTLIILKKAYDYLLDKYE